MSSCRTFWGQRSLYGICIIHGFYGDVNGTDSRVILCDSCIFMCRDSVEIVDLKHTPVSWKTLLAGVTPVLRELILAGVTSVSYELLLTGETPAS